MGGDLAPSWGDVKNIGRPNFRMTFFSEKNSILTPKISDDFYLFIYRILSAFCGRLSLLSNPFLDEKPLFQNKKFHRNTIFSQFVLCRASNYITNTTSRNIGRTDAWAVPTSNFILGDRPPVPLRLRPWKIPQFFRTYDDR